MVTPNPSIYSPARIKEIYAFTSIVAIVWYLHYKNNEESEYIHLHLKGLHFTPYLPIEESATTAPQPDISR